MRRMNDVHVKDTLSMRKVCSMGECRGKLEQEPKFETFQVKKSNAVEGHAVL